MSAQEYSATVSSGGEVLLPDQVRQALGISPGEAVTFVVDDGSVAVKRRRVSDGEAGVSVRRPPAPERLDETDRAVEKRGRELMGKVRRGEATWEDFKEIEDIARDEHVGDVVRKMLDE